MTGAEIPSMKNKKQPALQQNVRDNLEIVFNFKNARATRNLSGKIDFFHFRFFSFRYHSFSTSPKFSEILTFLAP